MEKKRNLRVVASNKEHKKEDDCIRILRSILQYYDKIKALEEIQQGTHIDESEIQEMALSITQTLHIKKYTLADGILILLSCLNGLREEIDRLQKEDTSDASE